MIFSREVTIISLGDFLDVYHKLRQRGMQYLFLKLKLSKKGRVASKWDEHQSSSDFWLVPEIQEDWNYKISGDKDVGYEDYVVQKYLAGKRNLKILSVGCGEGDHERVFARYGVADEIVGVDISSGSIDAAKKHALKEGLDITYQAGDFYKMQFPENYFDVVLFSSSLHHFGDINSFLKDNISPLMNDNGLIVVFEYAGPNRLQWRDKQIAAANRLLKRIPLAYKTFYNSTSVKKRVYRPGLIRMLMIDPSEAPDSANLAAALHNNFTILEEVKLGWNILPVLLKGIAHNFIDNDTQTKELIEMLIKEDDKFMAETGLNNAIFGVYSKR